jgi:hypothetical protein
MLVFVGEENLQPTPKIKNRFCAAIWVKKMKADYLAAFSSGPKKLMLI